MAAITSQFEDSLYPTEVLINGSETGLSKDSIVLLNQIRSIDKQRLIKRLGVMREETLEGVNRAIELSLGLVKL